MSGINLSLLVSTFERPWHLRRVLESVAFQRDMEGAFEVIVSDDGSTDHTQDIVSEFADSAEFPVLMTSHPHDGFQLARCRNEGVAVSSGEYLLFLDGDCLIPPDHLSIHYRRRRPGRVMGGHTILLEEHVSRGLTLEDIRNGEFVHAGSASEHRRLRWMAFKARLYNLTRHRRRPKLYGGNIGIWRSDYERINGYDLNFNGWGCEDDDLAIRLRMLGLQVQSINAYTRTYHLWHPPTPCTPNEYVLGPNYKYLNRADRSIRCVNGLDTVMSGNREFELLVDNRKDRTRNRAA